MVPVLFFYNFSKPSGTGRIRFASVHADPGSLFKCGSGSETLVSCCNLCPTKSIRPPALGQSQQSAEIIPRH